MITSSFDSFPDKPFGDMPKDHRETLGLPIEGDLGLDAVKRAVGGLLVHLAEREVDGDDETLKTCREVGSKLIEYGVGHDPRLTPEMGMIGTVVTAATQHMPDVDPTKINVDGMVAMFVGPSVSRPTARTAPGAMLSAEIERFRSELTALDAPIGGVESGIVMAELPKKNRGTTRAA